MIQILLSLFCSLIIAGPITQCNVCSENVNVVNDLYNISYTLCTFDTTLSAVVQKDLNVDWIMIGIECDDRCDGLKTLAEGYICSLEKTGYYEVENKMITEKVDKKIEFHHFKCDISDKTISAHVHRFMPNAWINNTSISYYVASGTGLAITNLRDFQIIY